MRGKWNNTEVTPQSLVTSKRLCVLSCESRQLVLIIQRGLLTVPLLFIVKEATPRLVLWPTPWGGYVRVICKNTCECWCFIWKASLLFFHKSSSSKPRKLVRKSHTDPPTRTRNQPTTTNQPNTEVISDCRRRATYEALPGTNRTVIVFCRKCSRSCPDIAWLKFKYSWKFLSGSKT